ncbi:MAG: sigma-54-dependent Fis family transcriptional regulator [Acidobacteria bacterium]|nr:sigma-54-dependent Fis family transcriptional regulator [Acidobacteriota bacterium]
MILIVDDDPSVVASLALVLKQAGYKSDSASTPKQALQMIGGNDFELVLQDMNFSRQTTGAEGLDLLKEIKAKKPSLPVILITAWGSIPLAVQGMRNGAADFITKPWTNPQLLQSVKTILSLAATPPERESRELNRSALDASYDFRSIIGTDTKLLRTLEVLGRVSATDASVLITGESGTGKELVAEAIHKNSPRRNGPFVKVNLGGISTSLFESEMFGHVKGAFTDAHQSRRGRFEIADGGTIFLDEIGDLPAPSQVKLLRVLQDRTYEVLGSSASRTVNVRIVSATNRNLPELVSGGEFREDLLYRLNLIAVHLPALRERAGDIPQLAQHFLTSIAAVYRRSGLSITPAALGWLQNREWPGNVRQLRHLIERAVLVSSSDELRPEDFLHTLEMEAVGAPRESIPAPGSMTMDEMERAMILRCLQHYSGNITRVAESLGMSRAALYRRFEKFGIKP